MIVLIGSTALNFHLPEHKQLDAKDTDLVGSYDEIVAYSKHLMCDSFIPINQGKSVKFTKGKKIFEAEIAWDNLSSARELMYEVVCHTHRVIYDNGFEIFVPTLDFLYTLKMSHRYKKNSPHFKKTIDNIIMMREMGAEIPDNLQRFFKNRERTTYTYSHPKLNQSKSDFFSGDGIDYEYCHDSIHQAVKIGDIPAYQYYSGGEVWSDMKKFMECNYEIRLNGVVEEAMTLAAERSQLVFNPRPNSRWSFLKALEKICSSITSGIFREFAYNNYYQAIALFDTVGYNYMNKVDEGIKSGLVKRLKKSEIVQS